jgi:hypothetical protein
LTKPFAVDELVSEIDIVVGAHLGGQTRGEQTLAGDRSPNRAE